jgi:1-acyl-sn-glycerol-3-phosphate acyltransferase
VEPDEQTAPGDDALLPAVPEDAPELLPAVEPERRLDDWGRSERVEGIFDRTVVEFFYRYWFRVEVEGVDNVPSAGGAMLVANHGGALPPDGAMIAKAIAQEHPRPRPLHLSTERTFAGVPGVGMLVTKLGGVAAHPANVHRLLFDESQLVLVFPEGRRGKALSERYRLRKFGRGEYVQAAMRARAPIVPIAVLGAEEAAPVFGRVNPLRRLTGLPRLPIASPVPLPAKFRIRFLEPVATDELGDAPWEDGGLVQSLSHDIRALIQENLLEMVAQRRSVWLG